MQHRSLVRASIVLLFALSLAACSSGPLTVTKFQHFSTPTELRSCKGEPAVPGLASDNQLAGYILDLRDAGADCRDKLNRRNQIEDAVK